MAVPEVQDLPLAEQDPEATTDAIHAGLRSDVVTVDAPDIRVGG